MSHFTISIVFKKWKVNGCMMTKELDFRPQILINQALRDLSYALQLDQCQSIAMIELSFYVACNTIRCYIHKLQYANCFAPMKPYLHAQYKLKRLKFARVHKHWSIEDWQKVIQTNESLFKFGKNNRQI